jgi:glutaredoxin 3
MSDVRAAVVIYTTTTCGYCHAAKRLLSDKGVAYREIPVDGRPDLRRWLVEASRRHTVPQIFINGASIGGYTDLAGLEGRQALDDLLAAAPPVDNPSMPS